jgi:hypothetical protein
MMMKRSAIMAGVLFGATVVGAAETVDFQADTAGAPPKGWIITMTGKGTPKWTVETDDAAPSKGKVLKQSGKATYPLALRNGTSIRDGFVEIRFKAIAGSEDRAAGIVWRAKDANNYYVLRANALENNCRALQDRRRCPQLARYRGAEGLIRCEGPRFRQSVAHAPRRLRRLTL